LARVFVRRGSVRSASRRALALVAVGSTLTLLQVLPARALQPGAVLFNPQSGPVGTTVTITGVGFQDDSVVTGVEFNGTPAAFAVKSDNQLRATVPAGATTGTISVTDDEGTFTTLTDFTVSSGEPPVVAAFAPTSGPAGGRVTITGTNFTGATAVSLNGRPASFTVASESQIAATVRWARPRARSRSRPLVARAPASWSSRSPIRARCTSGGSTFSSAAVLPGGG
jgi:hypothetical protein